MRRSCLVLIVALALCVEGKKPSDKEDDELLERLLSRQKAPARVEDPQLDRKRSGSTTKSYRKGSIDTESLRTQQLFQEQQRERIRVADREGKAEEHYLARNETSFEPLEWLVSCELGFYKAAYGVIDGCTPCTPYACRRIVRDGFATEAECAQLVDATESAMHNLFHRGGTTSIAPAHRQSQERLGLKGSVLFNYLINKVRLQVMEDYNLSTLSNSGALLTRLIANPPRDEWDVDPDHVYWNAHVDKANIATYDYSALLYLNDHGRAFDGGEFEFIDDDLNRLVEPRAGRLVTFTSGPENLHRVRKVYRGTRYVLAMWFTCSAAHQYQEEEEEDAADLQRQVLGLRSLNQELLRENEELRTGVETLTQEKQALIALAQGQQQNRGGRGRGGGRGQGGGDDKERQRAMLEDMAVQRRVTAEIELAKQRLRAAQAHASSSSSSSASSPSSSARQCFDVESCAAQWTGVGESEGGWTV